MAKTIRLSEEVYDELLEIKTKIETKATNATGSKASVTFDEVVKKLCEVYRSGEVGFK